MNKNWLFTGALLGALSVALGAFAAHSLKEVFPADSLAIFETGVRYQFYHVFAIFAAVLVQTHYRNNRALSLAAPFFFTGTVLFSGSLYLLAALKAQGYAGLGPIGIITPIGGVFFIAGWISLAAGVWKGRKE